MAKDKKKLMFKSSDQRYYPILQTPQWFNKIIDFKSSMKFSMKLGN